MSDCEMEWSGVVEEGGEGEIASASFHADVDCTRRPCGNGSSQIDPHWPFRIREFQGSEELLITICFQTLGGSQPISCTVDIPLDSSTHDLAITTPGGDEVDCHEVAGAVELAGSFAVEGDGLEVTHP